MTDVMSAALKTLLYGFSEALGEQNSPRVLFLNAQCGDGVSADWAFQQHFKPYADMLIRRGCRAAAAEGEAGCYDVVLYLLPKNMVEARYGLAQAVSFLSENGQIFCAAENNAGGTRLKALFKEFGFLIEGQESKNKARALWGSVSDHDQNVVDEALARGGVREVLDGRFVSQAGVFGWDKIDKGSEILTHYIPHDLKGKGADFGCGYGYLSDFVLSHCPRVKRLTCLDADNRAVEMCQRNMMKYDVEIACIWADLTQAQTELHHLDFVVMNPPFHEGKKQDIAVGKDFITSAYGTLKRGGALFMVANAHLPYESVLNDVFFAVEKLHEGQGFKVFKAVR